MSDELSRSPEIVHAPTDSVPAPGAFHTADDPARIIATPTEITRLGELAVNGRFGIYRDDIVEPIGPFILLAVEHKGEATYWRMVPAAWLAENGAGENRSILMKAPMYGHAAGQWEHAEIIDASTRGWFKGRVEIPLSDVHRALPTLPSAAPPDAQGGP